MYDIIAGSKARIREAAKKAFEQSKVASKKDFDDMIAELEELLSSTVESAIRCNYEAFTDNVERNWGHIITLLDSIAPEARHELFKVLMDERDEVLSTAKRAMSQCGCQFRPAGPFQP